MSFFQSLIRRFSRRQENAPPDSFQNEPLEDDAKLDSDTNWENNTNPDDSTNLKTDTSSEDDANPDDGTIFEDDTNLKGDQISKNHPNTEADAKPKGDASPNTTNVSSRDDKRTLRKSDAEQRYFDSLFCDAASEDEMNKEDKNTIATNAGDRPYFPLLVDEKNPPLPLAANTTPPAPSTPQYLTPAPPSSIFLRRVMNDSESPTITKGKYSTTPRNGTSTTTNESLTPSPDEKIFDQAQIADQPRLPWTWSTSGTKTKQPYEPTAVGKWWYAWAQDNRDSPRIISNIGRIMETELGVQRFGKEKCTRCQIEGLECWIYSLKATYQVNNPGSACARCRAEPRHVGCSLAQRRSNKRKGSPPPPPPPRLLLPKGGHQEYSTLYTNAGASMKE